jgi:DNA-binding transcriptional MocR family regulator
MSNHRREQLVQLSVKYNFLIIADEIFHLLDYEKEDQPRSFAVYHTAGTVIALH